MGELLVVLSARVGPLGLHEARGREELAPGRRGEHRISRVQIEPRELFRTLEADRVEGSVHRAKHLAHLEPGKRHLQHDTPPFFPRCRTPFPSYLRNQFFWSQGRWRSAQALLPLMRAARSRGRALPIPLQDHCTHAPTRQARRGRQRERPLWCDRAAHISCASAERCLGACASAARDALPTPRGLRPPMLEREPPRPHPTRNV